MGFLEKLKWVNPLLGNWSRNEWLFYFAIIPGILILVFLLPPQLKGYLILVPQVPTILSVFGNNYTHSETGHLLNNLLGYLVTLFILFNLEADRKRFHKLSALFFLAVPIIVSMTIVIFIPALPPTQGFSAVAAAFAGYLVFSAYSYLRRRYDFVHPNLFVILLIGNLTLICVLNNYGTMYIALTGLVLLIFVLIESKNLIQLVRNLIAELRSIPKKAWFEFNYKTGFFLFTAFLVFSLPMLVPLQIRIGGNIINSLAHYIGWAFGLLVPYFIDVFHSSVQLISRKKMQ